MSKSIFGSILSIANELDKMGRYSRRKVLSSPRMVKRKKADIIRDSHEDYHAKINQYRFDEPRGKYAFPSLDNLKSSNDDGMDKMVDLKGRRLLHILKTFNIDANLVESIEGASVTMYVIRLKDGVKVNRLKGLVSDLELNLPATHVRFVPIPSKMAIGVEIPNDTRKMVYFKDVFTKIDKTKYKIPFVLGTDIFNEPVCIDVTKTPHLLIAGATGSGKSVCINNLITGILCSRKPSEVRMIFVDPKMVELSVYNGIPHLIGDVITDAGKTIEMLDACIDEMNRRYGLLKTLNCRNIDSYNKRVKDKMKYVVVVMDEFADLMATNQKEIEPRIAKLAAMSRAVGIHLVLATQRPSADVITGVIKANIPSRISFQVSNGVNSRIILDDTGAEKLIGRGDMLLSESCEQGTRRIQGAYLSDEEVEGLVNEIIGK